MRLSAVYERRPGLWVAIYVTGDVGGRIRSARHVELHKVAGHPMRGEREANQVASQYLEEGAR